MTASRAANPHPEVQAFLELYESMDVPALADLSPGDARDLFEGMAITDAGIELASVADRTIDGPGGELAVRIYDPDSEPDASRPLILYFHGGGWVVGSVETHDTPCRKLAAETGYPVASVDYRLAPEHPFPEPLLDCYAALEWAADEAAGLPADPDRIVLAGDSAGGNLAAATALFARDRGGPDVAYQLLIYPATGDVTATDAYEENDEGYVLTADEVAWFRDHYLPDAVDRGNVYAVPRRAHDLSGLPPATVVTAGFDPLRDDGALYADRLEACGVPATLRNYDDVIHGFFGMVAEPVDLDRAHEAHADVADDLRDALE